MTVVVLDGSSTVRNKIRSILEEIDIPVMDLNCYENGEEALEFVQENDVDLIFSGIETQGLDGISFVESILLSKPKLVSRVFVVTSQTNTENFEEIKGVGAKRFIKKPINEEYFKHFVIPEIKKILTLE